MSESEVNISDIDNESDNENSDSEKTTKKYPSKSPKGVTKNMKNVAKNENAEKINFSSLHNKNVLDFSTDFGYTNVGFNFKNIDLVCKFIYYAFYKFYLF